MEHNITKCGISLVWGPALTINYLLISRMFLEYWLIISTDFKEIRIGKNEAEN